MRVLLIALSLVACSSDPHPMAVQPREPSTPQAARVVDPPLAPSDIRGEWRLETINGQTPPATFGGDPTPPILLTVGDFTLRARSQCVSFWRKYAWRGDAVVVTPANPGAMCARGLSDWERRFDRSLSAVTDIEIVGGRLRMTGPNVDMALEPAPPQPAQSLQGTWRLRQWQGLPPPAAMEQLRLEIDQDEMRANVCAFGGWRYRQFGPLLEVTPTQGTVCRRRLSAGETEFAAFMDGLHRATILPNGDLILDSPLTQVAFTRAE